MEQVNGKLLWFHECFAIVLDSLDDLYAPRLPLLKRDMDDAAAVMPLSPAYSRFLVHRSNKRNYEQEEEVDI